MNIYISIKIMNIVKHYVYTYFRAHYDETSYVWLSLGLRPDINLHDRLMFNIGNLPDEIIHKISTYMAPNKLVGIIAPERIDQ
jgi:hypothetical protein